MQSMIFNQLEFLFGFLPLVLLAFYTPWLNQVRVYILAIASFVFYAISGIEHAMTLMFGVLWVYWVSSSEQIVANKLRLAAAVVPPLLALGYYKYLGFALSQFVDFNNAVTREDFSLFSNIILPAGISFFTFQLVSFAIDRFRGNIPEKPSLPEFALYISFFPQLVAGPILRFDHVRDAISNLRAFFGSIRKRFPRLLSTLQWVSPAKF